MAWRPLVESLPAVGVVAPADNASLFDAPNVRAASSNQPKGVGRYSPRQVQQPQRDRAHANAHAIASDPSPPDAAESSNNLQQQGYDAGMQRAQDEIARLKEQYRDGIEALIVLREQSVRALEADLVRLSLVIAREVLMGDVDARQDFTARMAEHALTLLAQSDRVTLRLAPEELAALRAHKPELVKRRGLVLVEDSALHHGGVVAEGQQGRVDASLLARLSQMGERMLAVDAEPPP